MPVPDYQTLMLPVLRPSLRLLGDAAEHAAGSVIEALAVSPRRNAPVRGVASMTTPNQRPRISQPSRRTSTPVEIIAAQLPQVLVMHDASDGSQVGSCSGEPPRGNQYFSWVRTLTTTAWARAALDDQCGGQAVVCKGGVALQTAAFGERCTLPYRRG